jgi:hypothetical protein
VGINWSTVITAGLVSAVVSGVISVLTSRYVAGRQEQGKSAVAARKQMRDLIEPVLTQVRWYKTSGGDEPPRDPHSKETDEFDVELCAKMLIASRDLPPLRRKLVKRRLEKLYGPRTVSLCELESDHAVNPDETWLAIARYRIHHSSESLAAQTLPDRGQLGHGRECTPNSRKIPKLIRSLERLSRSR